MMKHSPALIVRRLLIDEDAVASSVASDASWPCFVSQLPDEPDNAIALFDLDALNSIRLMNGTFVSLPSIQVRLRSRSHEEGWSKMLNICTVLGESIVVEVELDTSSYLLNNFVRRSGIFNLGREDEGKRRYFFTASFMVPITETT
jgi:hypothetical protein